jgi:hypothetical protein
MAQKDTCGNIRCHSYRMDLRTFARLCGEEWDDSFRSKLGKAASKLYREIYGTDPPRSRSRKAYRNKVGRYPCGVLEQAYRQLKGDGASTVSEPTGTKSLMRQLRANDPAAT